MLHAAQSALDASVTRVVVVTGANDEAVCAALHGVNGVETCFNAQWKSGLASSLAAGLHFLTDGDPVDGVLVTLADQPHVTAGLLTQIVHEFENGHRLVAAGYDGVVGVPALFGREFLEELTDLKGDSGAGLWLRARSSDVRSIPMITAAFDVDTPGDVAKLKAADSEVSGKNGR